MKIEKEKFKEIFSLINAKYLLLFLQILHINTVKSKNTSVNCEKNVQILENITSLHRFLDTIQNEISSYLTDIDDSTHLEFFTQYSTLIKTQKEGWGRLYPTTKNKSLQNLRKEVRYFLLEGIDYSDCSIINSHPSFVASILFKNGLLADDSIILQLSKRKNDFFQELSDTTSVDKQTLETLFLSQISVENVFNHKIPQIQEALSRLGEEMILFLNILKKDPFFNQILKNNEPDPYQSPMMSAQTVYLQTLEAKELVHLISYIKQVLSSEGEDLLFLTPIHDGLLVYKKNVNQYNIKKIINFYNNEVVENPFIRFSCEELSKGKGVISEKMYHFFLKNLTKFEEKQNQLIKKDKEIVTRLEVLKYAKVKSPFSSQKDLAHEVTELNSLIILKASKEVFGDDFFIKK